MKTDLPAVAERLVELGIMQKSFCELNKDEVTELCRVIVDNSTDSHRTPFIDKGYLAIPATVPHEYKYWKYPYPESRGILERILSELGADDELKHKYIGAVHEQGQLR